MVIGKQTFQKVSEFGSITENNYRRWFQQILSVFHYFQAERKIKSVMELCDYSTLSKIDLRIIIVVFGLYTKLCEAIVGCPQLTLPFPGWVAWKIVKTSNISGTIPPIVFQSFTVCLGK